MKLQSFLVADAVSVGREGKVFIHGAGVNVLKAGTFPWSAPQIALFMVMEPDLEGPGEDHTINIEFLDPDGKPLKETINANVRLPASEHDGPTLINFAASFSGVEFETPGMYWLRATFDDNELGRLGLMVGGDANVIQFGSSEDS